MNQCYSIYEWTGFIMSVPPFPLKILCKCTTKIESVEVLMSRVWRTWNGNLTAFPLLITAVTKLGKQVLLGLSAVINANKMTLIVGQGSMTSVLFPIICLGSFWVVTCAFTTNNMKFVRWVIFNPTWRRAQRTLTVPDGFWTLNLLNGSEMPSLGQCYMKTPSTCPM